MDPLRFSSTERAGSIWSLAAMGWLEATGLFERVELCQGHYGAPSAKPTCLLVANVSKEILTTLESTLRSTPLPVARSIGVGRDGEWLTKRLKEYPESLCGLIAQFFAAWVDDLRSAPAVDTTGQYAWLHDLHQTLAEQPVPETVGPDYCRSAALIR